jgi:hypothetical protein
MAFCAGVNSAGASTIDEEPEPGPYQLSHDATIEGCHVHANDPSWSVEGVHMYGYGECTQEDDIQVNVNLQYYKKVSGKWKWVTLNPGGFDHRVSTFVSANATRPCRGTKFTHYHVLTVAKFHGVEGDAWSNDVQFYCGPV